MTSKKQIRTTEIANDSTETPWGSGQQGIKTNSSLPLPPSSAPPSTSLKGKLECLLCSFYVFNGVLMVLVLVLLHQKECFLLSLWHFRGEGGGGNERGKENGHYD